MSQNRDQQEHHEQKNATSVDEAIDQNMKEENIESASMARSLRGKVRVLFTVIAVFGALFHLYILNLNAIDPWIFRSAHLLFGVVLGLMLFPGWKGASHRVHPVDWLLILLSIGIFTYIFVNFKELVFRFGVVPTPMDAIVATLGVLLVLELTRRTSGWTLPLLAAAFVIYAFAGPGYNYDRFVTYIYSLDGIFGVTMDVSSKYILLFIIFGAFLQMSGVGKYFIDFSFALAGGMRGGPAKVSVISSGLMGMMNGTSAGNAVATGSLTIPLMKRVGYQPRFAAATEATASAGGQIMIPIMGAGAFLMAEITGMPYKEIVIAATIPALLYFLSVYFMVDFEALKKGMKGIARKELPSFKTIAKQAYLFIPIVILIGMLLMGRSPVMSGTISIIACFVISWIQPTTRMGLKKLIEALELGMKNVIQLLAVCACAGIIVGVIALTGVGLRFSSLLLSVADNNIFLALVFAMLISIILGMGMPTTAAYAVAASVVAPGLVSLGIEPLIAHMFVFYYAVMSAITPPVALAAYAAAGVAGTDPFKTGVQAFRLGIAAFIVPFIFFYSPQLLMIGDTLNILLAVVTAAIGIYLLSASVQAWFMGRGAGIVVRLILAAGAISLIHADPLWDLYAFAFVGAAALIQRFITRKDVDHPISA
ncbi:TRAP transporter permease [Caldalkalibacillus salinus]|uniref:TRAP transporter permease n=1 Tax=Caldalkalibacillus salinus TaxID=2803787 RepID=UPI001920C570|nr:TRAP transporter permease [Caldalkalibacillus salinus]